MLAADLRDILFLDIETVPAVYRFVDLDPAMQALFEKKVGYKISEDMPVDKLYEKAGIWAEFGKVVSVAMGKFTREEDPEFHIRVYASHDERKLLERVREVLDNFDRRRDRDRSPRLLCAHNGKEFDFPYLARRMLVNRISLPPILQVHGKKPWEVPFCDTMELWSFGDRKHYTSLELLCRLLDVPVSKENMDGSDVARVYYEEGDLERIARYCGHDVEALANLFLRFKEAPLTEPARIKRSVEILE